MSALATTAQAAGAMTAGTPHRGLFARHPELFTLLLIVLVGTVVGSINQNFFQLSTVFDILRSSTVTGLFALGVLIVLAAGGIDVSFTAIAVLTMYAITKAVLGYWPEAPFFLIISCGALIGALLGACNGFLIHRLKAPSLIVTIGTQYLLRGFLLTFVGTLFFAPFAFSAPWPADWDWQDMGVILFLGAFVTLGAYLLYNWSVTQVKVTLAAAYVNLIPVFTLLLAYLLLGETLGALQWVACAAVLAGIGVGQLPVGKHRVRSAAAQS